MVFNLCSPFNYVIQDGTVFVKKGQDEEPFEFKIDEEQVIDGLDRAVKTMKKRKIAQITIQPECAFGAFDASQELAVVPANSIVYYEVEIVSFVKVSALEFSVCTGAQAYTQLVDLELAELDIKKALEIDPDNRDVKVEYKVLKEKKKEYNKKDAQFYGSILAKMNKFEQEKLANEEAKHETAPMAIDS